MKFIPTFLSFLVFLTLLGCKEEIENENIDYEGLINEASADPQLNIQSKYLIAIGDIQEYTGYPVSFPYYPFLLKTMAWIRKQSDVYNNIVGVLQVGDITWTNLEEQWDRYYKASKFIDEQLPILICTGNHDYSWEYIGETPIIPDRTTTKINDYSPNPALTPFISSRFEDGKIENYIASFDINNQVLHIAVLEFGPRTEVIEWLEKILKDYPDEKFLILTHEYICYGEIPGKDSYAVWHFEGTSTTFSTPQDIFYKLIRKYGNIIGLLCGHNGFYEHYQTRTEKGTVSTSVLFNLQLQENGGNGLIQLWEFPTDENVINISLYSTIINEIIEPEKYSFTIKF